MDRDAALMLAHTQRKAIAVLRGRLLAGRITIAQALGDPVAARLPVSRVMQWMPGYGRVRTDRLLGELQIWPTRRCQHLTARQRQLIEDRMA